MLTHWVIPISGYTQDRKQKTGLSELWREFHEEFTDPKVCIQPVLPWNHDWEKQAGFINVNSYSDPDKKPKIAIIGYSYGGGWGAQKLAEQLRIYGLEVHRMILADPVYRSDRLLCRWRTLFRRGGVLPCLAPVIKIPSNVLYVESTRQSRNWPQAHKLEPDSPSTRMDRPVIDVARVHNQMDESLVFKELARSAVKQLIKGEEL